MTPQPTPTRASQVATVDQQMRRETAAPSDHPLPSAPALPRPDASEPAELTVVAVRGYN